LSRRSATTVTVTVTPDFHTQCDVNSLDAGDDTVPSIEQETH